MKDGGKENSFNIASMRTDGGQDGGGDDGVRDRAGGKTMIPSDGK